MKKIIITTIILANLIPFSGNAANLSDKLSGRILLDVERNGEAWYIYPKDKKRYYLGRPADAFKVMRELGLGISESNFQRIAQAGMPVKGDTALARALAGTIVLQVERNGEAWYINPLDLKKYFLGRPEDAFKVMRELGLGITREDLARIHKPGTDESINKWSKYEHKKINAVGREFTVDMITINLDNPRLWITTDATALSPAPNNDKYNGFYSAKSLGKFVTEHDGFAGVNGTYFCAYASCESNNYYFFPVYDTFLGKIINEDQLKYWTTGPIMAFDIVNNFYYFKDSRELKSLENFETVYGTKLQAAIGNKPRLIENGMNQLIEWELDSKQKNTRAMRNAIGYKKGDNGGKGTVYLVITQNATVPDLAEIMKAIGVDYALNLDGGYSSALWYGDEYMVMPGRDVPNAIVFSEK
ncbi:hypothetical protein A2303_07800 [Candidatus Falkowbacteria bacterium RIFOXYB2_FULL_47_14]|uniref:Phosphodiester glycosidase domain-containing protein n=1 Tax=Candidatus Falkowbacteria bacterium RIFOXYA2_FULL_47_19 TaxID=1797994 RepID=A0A1F5SML3_9BACT|nr:MAG: hypothetical protein A2227_04945 [Candidatus Falkowbacteria bacterium RIFOXYA2_FULL_47_19]OGF36032.1 MAG: hypothetical protein A2468_00650 [Candidatus Falkowbacteria bacterium RIFOXYC2_FULL_46_15]OGF43422.1 MAG: hypothetical protein A2303_07800 [Candidatus Falkowbacteria bacterium RIFOXYB2_FULL_47_14]